MICFQLDQATKEEWKKREAEKEKEKLELEQKQKEDNERQEAEAEAAAAAAAEEAEDDEAVLREELLELAAEQEVLMLNKKTGGEDDDQEVDLVALIEETVSILLDDPRTLSKRTKQLVQAQNEAANAQKGSRKQLFGKKIDMHDPHGFDERFHLLMKDRVSSQLVSQ